MAMAMKRIICVRHSITECNEALARTPWGTPGFADPGLYDTVLSERGLSLAKEVRHKLETKQIPVEFEGVQLVVSSPLTRALQTSEILFGSESVIPKEARKVAQPLLRERCYLASDVGKPRSVLETSFPNWDFQSLPIDDSVWWYTTPREGSLSDEWRPTGRYLCPGEPKKVFNARISQLKSWIMSQQEDKIVIVAHWGLLRGLFGLDVSNCAIISKTSNDFLDAPPEDC